MGSWSPTAEGFRTIFRNPALSLAEITWRWCFAAAAWLLAFFGLFAYLDTLPVSSRDQIVLRTGAPTFVLRALAHIAQGSAYRFLLAILIFAAGLSVLWIVVASLGRAVTLESLLESVRARANSITQRNTDSAIVDSVSSKYPLRSLTGLHLLRALVFLLTVAALAGAAFAASLLSPDGNPHPVIAFLTFLWLALFVLAAGISLNWLLSLATLLVVRNHEDTIGAVAAAMNLCRDHLGPVLSVGIWFGLAHLTFFFIASSVVGLPLSLLAIVPPGFVLLSMFLITLLYFAIADSLYVGRLAGYAAILEAPPPPAPDPLAPEIIAPRFAGPVSTQPNDTASAMVDQSELILSDVSDTTPRNENNQ